MTHVLVKHAVFKIGTLLSVFVTSGPPVVNKKKKNDLFEGGQTICFVVPLYVFVSKAITRLLYV